MLVSFLRKHPYLVLGTLLVALANNIVTITIPVAISKFYQVVLHTEGQRGKLLSFLPFNLDEISHFFYFFAALILLKTLFTFAEKYGIGIAGERFTKEIREQLFHHHLLYSVEKHEQKAVGNYLLRYSGDLTSLQNYLTKGIVIFTKDVLFIVLALIVLCFFSWQLVSLMLLLLPVFVLMMWGLNKILKPISKQRRGAKSNNLSFVSERLGQLMTIKVFNRETIEEKSFVKRSDKLYHLGQQYQLWYSIIQALLPAFSYLLLLAIMGYIYYASNTQNNGSTLLVFVMLIISLMTIIKRLLNVNTVWQSGRISMEKVSEMLQPLTANKDSLTELNELIITNGQVVFDNVSFAYNPNKPLLQNLSLVVQANTLVWIKGKQGAGKSTFFELLLHLYTPNSGRILIDGQDIGGLTGKSVRREVTLVSNDVPLLGNTVFDAISYSRADDKREKAQALLQKIGFVDLDLDDKIGESGKQLSAGQRKLLIIARALLTNKKIILLDEPFVDLDEQAQVLFVKQLNKLKQKRTIFLIDKNPPQNLLIDQIVEL
jgi:ABC-type multidrug transport system fused ATPase/permease subunit